ncbi:MAG: HsdR family type I site-specific deoxyribonuclease [Caldilineae bacterium]|nr:MAG: HsdR family type I site-specific deoxyribonuclease [Caldilineae bacterium]
MSLVARKEIETQARVVRLFHKELGYDYLGNWIDRQGNRNIEEALLRDWLRRRGYSDTLINRALHELSRAAALGEGRHLYDANKAVYELLRYGVKVREGAGQQAETVWLIDWDNPEANDFGIAEEVTIHGEHTKRPDIVLYVNGIALGVLELKRSTVSVSEGIRQNLDNQKKTFIRSFFTTQQLVMAGNDTEGLRYGTIETPEKYYLTWKEEGAPPSAPGEVLDDHLRLLCKKERFLEIVHDFVAFDAGIKKLPRHNQYFGVKAAQERIRRREGGIIWHTQGSGKSLTMVWLTKWIRENVENARVLVVTDRTELDEQIESVYHGVNEDIYRTKSGADLISQLNSTKHWLMCSLVHKFGRNEDKAAQEFIDELHKSLSGDFSPKGEIFVFVDECHRTQSGKLHQAMKKILPDAMFIGFTGTPLLKKDKRTSIEVFGPYIHTYKFDEAVRDGVILDLRYEARDIDQKLTSREKVDQWFEAKTRGLSDLARLQLKQRWGTLQNVLSSQSRLQKIVNDILLDMDTRDRLMSGRGNAILVAGSIYQACKFYELFSKSPLAGKCAIVTSYKPSPNDIKGEETGEGHNERLHQYEIYRKMLADWFEQDEERAMYRVEEFEQQVKEKFIKEPGQMKLLIVVDKLLTGFDAPPATYLYIDKKMQDHGLFQAICRVNRLHTEDKEYGYIVDYRDLFKSLESAVRDYTSGAFSGYDKEDVAGLLEDRLEKGRERLEETLEQVRALCEPVPPPRDTRAYLHYFCAENTADKEALKDNEPKRIALYKAVASLVRAFANLANDLPEAGYSAEEIERIRQEVKHYEHVREEVKLASGDYIDLKAYEPAMRHLLDTYIQADESRVLSAFDDLGLVDLIIQKGTKATDQLPEGIKADQEAVAETIENNLRKLIIDEQPVNPKYYEQMSDLLDALIEERKQQALEYEEYLKKIQELARKVRNPASSSHYPPSIDTPARRALYDNLRDRPELEAIEVEEHVGTDVDLAELLALEIDTVVQNTRQAEWRGNRIKERRICKAIAEVIGPHDDLVQFLFEIVKNQDEY